MSPLCRSSASPMPVFMLPNVIGLHKDPRHEEVDVGDTGHLDGTAEDVPEHQHEDDGLDRGEHEHRFWATR